MRLSPLGLAMILLTGATVALGGPMIPPRWTSESAVDPSATVARTTLLQSAVAQAAALDPAASGVSIALARAVASDLAPAADMADADLGSQGLPPVIPLPPVFVPAAITLGCVVWKTQKRRSRIA